MVSLLNCNNCIILHNSNNDNSCQQTAVNQPKNISYSNNNNKRRRNSNRHMLKISLMLAIWSIATLAGLTLGHGAAVYSNAGFLGKPTFEQLCNEQEEHFVESDGRESSLIIEFNPNVLADKRSSCTRILSAPSNYGFIVRLILPKMRRHQLQQQQEERNTVTAEETTALGSNVFVDDEVDVGTDSEKPTKAVKSALNEMTTLIEKLNATALKTILGRSCPLKVFSSLDPHTPQWRLDPCQLEDAAPEMEDPVRLLHGRVRIVWEHAGQRLNSKLMITALGKGEQCRGGNKHPCLKIGDEPLLCISKDLVCDGIRHCPNSNEYNSDEDYGLCWQRQHVGEPLPKHIESELFEHFALEVFRNLFLFDVPSMPAGEVAKPKKELAGKKSKPAGATPALPQGLNVTTLRKVKQNGTALSTGNDTLLIEFGSSLGDSENTTASTQSRRNSTRHGVHTDLSKYGPWGYLMLGMLLCGGALLICGLWASASQQAAQNERESAMANAAANNGISIDHASSATSPPNYDDLDPPPAYSVLFPNQKTASTATLNGIIAASGTMTTTATGTPLSPSSRPACSGAAGLALRTTNAQAPMTSTAITATPAAAAAAVAAATTQPDSQIPN